MAIEVIPSGAGRALLRGPPPEPRGVERMAKNQFQDWISGTLGQTGHPMLGSGPAQLVGAQSEPQAGQCVTLTCWANPKLDNGNNIGTNQSAWIGLIFGNGFIRSPEILMAVGTGISIPLPGTAWTINAYANTPSPISVSAFLTRFPKPRSPNASPITAPTQQFTSNPGLGPNVITLNVPAFCTSFRLDRSSPASGPFQVAIRDAVGNPLDVTVINPGDTPPWVVVPQNAAQVFITNQGGAADTVLPLFALDF